MAHNDKSSVTKEQNEKHRKILEGLMKLPENRECADCKSKYSLYGKGAMVEPMKNMSPAMVETMKNRSLVHTRPPTYENELCLRLGRMGPRWASVNLGIFLCIGCSGIHRSLGVHISKVRSATLDTWLPDQVAFMQGMGNAKANAFWEAELRQSFKRPSENDHGGLESFIRSKYEARRWVLQSNKSPTKAEEELHSTTNKPRRRLDNGREKKIVNTEKVDMKNHDDSSEFPEPRRHDSGTRTSTQSVSSFTFSDTSVSKDNVKHPIVLPAPKPPQNPLHPVQAVNTQNAPKVEAPTDLFDLLNIEEPIQTGGSVAPLVSSDDQSWDAFQSAEPASNAGNATESLLDTTESCSSEPTPAIAVDSTKNDIMAGLEDLFKGSPAVSSMPSHVQQPQKEVKKEDILSLFGKTSIASPYVAHQQQMAALLAQRQSVLMSASTASGIKIPVNQPLQNMNFLAENLLAGSGGVSEPAKGINNSGIHLAGQHYNEVGVLYQQTGILQNSPLISSSNTALQGVITPDRSSLSYSVPGLNANGAPNMNKNRIPFNGISKVNIPNEGNNGVATADLASSIGNTYDFSALTAAALSKQ